MKLELKDISDDEFELMHGSILRLLDEFGVLYEDAAAREMVRKAGNPVDEGGRAHLRRDFVEARLAEAPAGGFMMYGRAESRPRRVAVGEMSFRPSTGSPYILDGATRRRRPATMDDARVMVTLTDALDGYGMVNSVVSPPGTPGSELNLRRFADSHRHSLKPSDITVMKRAEVNAIARIAAAIRGGGRALRDRPLTVVDVAVITPLRCTGDQSEALMECARWGLPVEVLTSPAMGLTAPITLAGSVVVAMAEVIAALCLVYLIEPGLGIVNTARVSPTNMRTTAYNYGAPELGMASALTAALSNRYHIPTNLYGFGTVAQAPGVQSTMERTFAGLLMALSRPHMITGPAMLENAMLTSPEQLVIDNEAIRFIQRIRRPITIDEESIGLDVFMKSMSAEGAMLADEHTVSHLRAGEMLDAGLGQWLSRQEWESQGRIDLFERARQRVEQILASHHVEPFDAPLAREIDSIIEQSAL